MDGRPQGEDWAPNVMEDSWERFRPSWDISHAQVAAKEHQKIWKGTQTEQEQESILKVPLRTWRADELQRLRDAFQKHGRNWVAVSMEVKTRNNDDCRKKVMYELRYGRMTEPKVQPTPRFRTTGGPPGGSKLASLEKKSYTLVRPTRSRPSMPSPNLTNLAKNIQIVFRKPKAPKKTAPRKERLIAEETNSSNLTADSSASDTPFYPTLNTQDTEPLRADAPLANEEIFSESQQMWHQLIDTSTTAEMDNSHDSPYKDVEQTDTQDSQSKFDNRITSNFDAGPGQIVNDSQPSNSSLQPPPPPSSLLPTDNRLPEQRRTGQKGFSKDIAQALLGLRDPHG